MTTHADPTKSDSGRSEPGKFEPTHIVPDTGLPTWPQPDGSQPNGPPLPAYLPVAVLQEHGDWALVQCSNGWQAWVDARSLVPVDAEAVLPAEARGPVRVGPLTVSVPLVGGLAVIISSFLPWFGSAVANFPNTSAYRFPIQFLTDSKVFDGNQDFVAQPDGTSIGTALLVLGIITVILSQTSLPSIITRGIGWLVLVMSTLFLTQLQRGLGQLIAARVFSLVGLGVYVAALSGLVLGLARGPTITKAAES